MALIEYGPLPMDNLGVVNVRMDSPLVLEATLPRSFITVFPDIQRKFTDVPAG